MDVNWTELGNTLIATLIPILVPFLVALCVQGIRLLQAKIKAEQPTTYEKLEKLCSDAVLIAEQMNLGKLIEDKKSWAVAYVQAQADKTGLKFNIEEIELMIEKAVYQELNWGKK